MSTDKSDTPQNLQDTASGAYIDCISAAISKCVSNSDASDKSNLIQVLQTQLTADEVISRVISMSGATTNPGWADVMFECQGKPGLTFRQSETGIKLDMIGTAVDETTKREDKLRGVSVESVATWNGSRYLPSHKDVQVEAL